MTIVALFTWKCCEGGMVDFNCAKPRRVSFDSYFRRSFSIAILPWFSTRFCSRIHSGGSRCSNADTDDDHIECNGNDMCKLTGSK